MQLDPQLVETNFDESAIFLNDAKKITKNVGLLKSIIFTDETIIHR